MYRMLKATAALLALMSSLCGPGHADSFEISSDYEQLEGQVILAVGNMSSLSVPTFPNGDPLQLQATHFYKIGVLCFAINPGQPFEQEFSEKSALLLANNSGTFYVAELSSSGSQIKVDMKSVTLYTCASIIKQSIGNLNRQLEKEMKDARDVLNRLKNMRQAQ